GMTSKCIRKCNREFFSCHFYS
uniref:Uncharacterized protein n=1 Tax=Amphimedon queenslandica TaxID=400682 RepID=A0A1X7V281_AMPQE